MQIFILIFSCFALGQATTTPDPDYFYGGSYSSEGTILPQVPTSESVSPRVVEVAVVCDKSCRSRFQNDAASIHQYVTSLFRHLQWQFQTEVPTVPLTFRVTSVTIKDNDIPVNYGISMRIGDLVVDPQRDTVSNFASWMYINRNEFSTFDIAMLITDNWPLSSTMYSSACMVNDEDQVVGSVVHSLSTKKPGISIAAQFAYTLGSGQNFTSQLCHLFKFNCNLNLPYSPSLLSLYRDGPFELPWLNVTENIINFLSSENASCLQTTNLDETPFLDTTSVTFKSETDLSMEQQCELLFTQEENSNLEITESSCKEVVCKMVTRSGIFFVGETKNLTPLDGTKCENDGRCFRGECVKPPGIQIVSATNGHCLEGKGSTGHPELVHCSSSKTPFNTFAIEKLGNNFLIKPYLTGAGSVHQCLSLHSGNLEYANCNNDDEEMQWTALELKDESYRGDFVLFHPDSKTCLFAGESSLETTSDCHTSTGIFWRFLDESGLVRNISVAFQEEPKEIIETTTAKPLKLEEQEKPCESSSEELSTSYYSGVKFTLSTIGCIILVIVLLSCYCVFGSFSSQEK